MSAFQPSWTEEYSQDVRAAPYLVPRSSSHALDVDIKRRSSDSSIWSSSKNLPTFSMMDTSGDESDGNRTTDSIESSMTKLDWVESSNENVSFPNARVSQPQLSSTVPFWPALSTGVGPSVATVPSSTMESASAPQSMLSQMRAPIPSMTGASLVAPTNATKSMMLNRTGKLALDTNFPTISQPNEQTPKAMPQLTRLCTSNLNFPAGLQVPITPSRNLASALSPGNSIAGAITQDWNTWLDEPIVPSPMYEQGPCTGWNGLISATDASRTPTARDAQMRTDNEASDKQASIDNEAKKSFETSSPAFISAIDWWRQDTSAQWQFHKYTMAHFPVSHILRADDPKSTLSLSVMSRFLTYCSFLFLREPSAPHPPFLHRNLLMIMKDRLPAPLAIASSVLAALAMRLPTSESWIWRLVGKELSSVIETARGILIKVREIEQGKSWLKGIEQPATSFDDAWELVGIVQALWCYTVVSVFEEVRYPMNLAPGSPRSAIGREWYSRLIPETIDILQAIVSILAREGLHLQERAWESWSKSLQQDTDVKPFGFLWWSLCETIRRTVLATHALLILLRHLRIGCNKNESTSLLGYPPYPSLVYPVNWEPVMALKLPVVADIFDASNEAVWRVHLENAISHSSNETFSLHLLINNRPKFFEDRSSEMNTLVYSYFQEHDEFTNVCLSTIFGLSNSL